MASAVREYVITKRLHPARSILIGPQAVFEVPCRPVYIEGY